MEMIVLAAVSFAALSAAIWQWWRRRQLQQAVYDYADQLDQTLSAMLDGRAPDARMGRDDDLWGHTNERLLQLARQTAEERAALSDERAALQALVTDISHQTKTPLANIQLYLERLEECGDLSLLPKLAAQVAKLDFLLASMVRISRLETGAITICKESALLTPTLAEAFAAIVPHAEEKGICLSAEVDERISLSYDRKWTAEAVFNLLDNAVKYTSAGGAVSLRVERGPIFTEIRVSDTGKGIARERQGAIFTRFYREPEVHASEGAGLGLYLARLIVERQGGFIEVDSEESQGSTFTINLPNA